MRRWQVSIDRSFKLFARAQVARPQGQHSPFQIMLGCGFADASEFASRPGFKRIERHFSSLSRDFVQFPGRTTRQNNFLDTAAAIVLLVFG